MSPRFWSIAAVPCFRVLSSRYLPKLTWSLTDYVLRFIICTEYSQNSDTPYSSSLKPRYSDQDCNLRNIQEHALHQTATPDKIISRLILRLGRRNSEVSIVLSTTLAEYMEDVGVEVSDWILMLLHLSLLGSCAQYCKTRYLRSSNRTGRRHMSDLFPRTWQRNCK